MRSTHEISIESLFDDMANGNDEKSVSDLTDAIQNRDVETLKKILGTVKWTPPGKQYIVWPFTSAIQAGDIEILKPLLTKVDWADDQEALINLLFIAYHQEKQFDIV